MIFTIIITILFITALAISYYAYTIAFRASKESRNELYHLPKGEQYTPHTATIQKCIDEMLSHTYEEIFITSHDGQKLFGRYYHVADSAPVQILMHGYKSSSILDFCGGVKLAMNMGQNVLAVDQRSHGKSEGSVITFGIEERRDCLSWITYISKRFGYDVPIFLCGISMGAATILMAADQKLPHNVKGMIADCPYSSPKEIIMKVSDDLHFPPKLIYPFIRLGALLFGHFHLEESDAVRAVRQATIPILLFHGDDDRFVPCEMSKKIAGACASPVTLEIVPGAGHGLCYMVGPKQYEEATIRFIQSVL